MLCKYICIRCNCITLALHLHYYCSAMLQHLLK
uniref:Uncharacterized protein n=1 Tax=Siphoviridae sp. cttm829 TaxID=2825707 RepID=A0A8S5PG24_9CAUD|nr:MAG TPA: hypothetical protein [Siphoviridae sp. cttm829]